ncbi:13995_t:CDS:10 [Entrophospora sp. SA101]|nr:13995_t:CDS:10 [Entrophospora sp. SA101]
MSVIVTTKIPQNAVFFAGERSRCEITFTCPYSYSGRVTTEDKTHAGNNVNSQISTNHPFANLPTSTTNSTTTNATIAKTSNTIKSETKTVNSEENSNSDTNENNDKVATPLTESFHFADAEIDEEGGLINLHKADISDTISISDYDTTESTPRSSVDFYGIGYSDRGSGTWNGSLIDYKKYNISRHSSNGFRCSSSPSLTQKYETLLWGFAQIVGQFTVDASLIKSIEFEPLKTKTMYRPASGNGAGGAVGGGTLGIFSPNSMNQSSLADLQERADSKSIPVFSTPPSILFCDLHLAPGESQTYTYESRLPNDLPPTHRGKAIKFYYNLIIGTHRGVMNHQSHIVQLPFRSSFLLIKEDGSRPVYDLMNPVVIYKDEAVITFKEDMPKPKLVKKRDDKREEFMDYIKKLVQNNGAVIPSFQVSITLENSEIVESSIAKRPQNQISRQTRKVHGEHHEFCLNSERISFSISIPTHATPDFSTTGVKLQWGIRLEFITGPKGHVPLVTLTADERHHYYQAVEDVRVETFDCFIPIKVYPTSYESARTTL